MQDSVYSVLVNATELNKTISRFRRITRSMILSVYILVSMVNLVKTKVFGSFDCNFTELNRAESIRFCFYRTEQKYKTDRIFKSNCQSVLSFNWKSNQ